ncbi:EamA family transporter [Nocardioides luteus]|uniref:EamA family transporter n=1 Tax=Nocardioides luteus TaxID=1844 RepID=A0A1J4NAE4_9ACTN|nr:EamA family transporter [Nocardioides luteus]
MTVVLWSSFALSTRGIGGSSLTVADAAFLRFMTPVVLLAPLLPSTIRAVRRERPQVLALLLVGGLPHFLVFAFGARLTSAALTGMLVPGTVPLFVTLLAMARGRASLPPRRLLALGLITAGVAVSGFLVGGGASLGGVGLLLVGGFAWAVFTTGLQRTSLTLLQMVLTICTVSSTAVLVLAVSGVMPSHLLTGTAELGDVVALTVLQGIGTGLMSTLCYAFSVKALGSSRASVGGAVSPVLTAVVAVPVFGERIGLGLAVALMLIVAAVAMFNGPASPDDAAVLEPEDVVRGGDALLVVGDAHDRGPAGGLLGEDLAGALPAGGVEPRGRFVQEQDLRVLDDALSQ